MRDIGWVWVVLGVLVMFTVSCGVWLWREYRGLHE